MVHIKCIPIHFRAYPDYTWLPHKRKTAKQFKCVATLPINELLKTIEKTDK